MSASQARVKESAEPLIPPRAPGPANETPPEILRMQEDARELSRKLRASVADGHSGSAERGGLGGVDSGENPELRQARFGGSVAGGIRAFAPQAAEKTALMRVSALPEFRLDIQRAPAAVALWALDWVECSGFNP